MGNLGLRFPFKEVLAHAVVTKSMLPNTLYLIRSLFSRFNLRYHRANRL